MKKSILLLSLAAWTLGVYADPVSADDAKIAAVVWVVKNAAFGASGSATNVVTVADPNNSSVTLWHQVYMDNGGMLIVAPRTEIEPVIYALDNTPKKLPPTLIDILTNDVRRRLQFLGLYPLKARSMKSAAEQATAKDWGEVNHAKWVRLMIAAATPMTINEPLRVDNITVNVRMVDGFENGGRFTHWNQQKDANPDKALAKPLYNLYVTNNAPVGCAATLLATLAQFYGTTNALAVTNTCYYCKKDGDPEVAGSYATKPGKIDWSLLDGWDPANPTPAQRDLIGRVAYNAAVGLKMHWADGGSGADSNDLQDALKNVFGFEHARYVEISKAANPTQMELEKLIYNQLRAGVPVGMAIDGHGVAAVGYGIDADNVERVRVFLGWGGGGDGWFAFPKIETQAVPGGPVYISDIVSGVLTMIAYDNDDIVPVVGRVVDSSRKPLSEATLTLPGVPRTIQADTNGYFATRVPLSLAKDDCTIECNGKTATFVIGENAVNAPNFVPLLPTEEGQTTSAEVVKLMLGFSAALPAAFEFPILGCTVAYSAEEAKALAMAEGKAIFHVRGYLHETNTSAVLSHVYKLAANKEDSFANNFVYFFSHAYSAKEDGNVVSYGTYLPSDFGASEDGEIASSALTYGYLNVTASESATNVTVNTFVDGNGASTDVGDDVTDADTIRSVLLASAGNVFTDGVAMFDAVPVPVEGASSVMSIAPDADGKMNIAVAVANGRAGFKYELKASADFVTWTTVGEPQQVISDGPIAISHTVNSTTTPMQFFKLVVTMETAQ